MKRITKEIQRFPYFDDYNIEKNFYKVLFKPQYDLQTRELNQIQTILKEQLGRLGNHIFKNGSIVIGCDHQVNDTSFYLSVLPQFEINDELISFLNGKILVSGTKKGQILSIEKEETGYISIIINDVSQDILEEGDICNIILENTNESQNISLSFRILQRLECSFIKFNRGFVYFNGEILYVKDQKKILSIGNKNFSGSIGLKIESTILSNENKSDFLKVEPILDTKPPEEFLDSIIYAEQEIIGNFIEFIRMSNGVLLKDIRVPIYNDLEDTLARRTYDESGDYTVKPFIAKVLKDEKDNSVFKLDISPGLAYIHGYEFESISTRSLSLDRALDTYQKELYELPTFYGSYIILQNFQGFFDCQKVDKIDLLDDTLDNITFAPYNLYTPSIIGSARVRHVKYYEDELHLYIFDLQLNDNKTFSDVKSICLNDYLSINRGMGDLTESLIYDSNSNKGLLFELPEEYIKTLRNTDLEVDADFSIQKTYTDVLFEPSSSPGAPSDITYGIISNQPKERFLTSPVNFIIVSQTDHSIFYPDSISAIDTEYTQVSLSINKESFIGDVYAIVNVNFAKEKSKVLKSTSETISLSSLSTNEEITLEQCDVKIINSITIDNIDNISNFTFNHNRTPNSYQYSSVSYNGSDIVSNCNIIITYDYYDHIGSGYFSIDSYTNKDNIPEEKYNLKQYKLSRCIDFRYDEKSEISNAYIPIPEGNLESSYSYYLSRIDKLIATSSKNFQIIKGVPSKNPTPPKDNPLGMTLYTISIPAYTDDPKQISLKYHENKRYTMNDIYKLQRRIENLEYYTSLSLSEKDTKDLEILDEFGNNRFKNGFVVDNFKNFKSVDLKSVDNTCCFDIPNSIMRPSFEMFNHPLLYNPYESTTRRCGDLITIPFTEVPFIEQLKATETMNLQPFEVFIWKGDLKLFPETDEWVDTETKPDIIANQYGDTDIWAEIGTKAFTTQWSSWETTVLSEPKTENLSSVKHVDFDQLSVESVKKLWNPTVDSSVDTVIIKAYNDWVSNNFKAGFAKTEPDGYVNGKPAIYLEFKGKTEKSTRDLGQTGFGQSQIISNSTGESVTDVAISPYIRGRDIQIKAKNLKPNTSFYALFDKDDVTLLCNSGETITSDSSGKIDIIFQLPSGKYHNGEHIFRLQDSLDTYEITSFCESKYTANGLKQTKQDTIISTREPVLVTDTIKSEENYSTVAAWVNNNIILPTPTPSITPTNQPTPTPTPTSNPATQLYVVVLTSYSKESKYSNVSFTVSHSYGTVNQAVGRNQLVSIMGPYNFGSNLNFSATVSVSPGPTGMIMYDANCQSKTGFTSNPGWSSPGPVAREINRKDNRFSIASVDNKPSLNSGQLNIQLIQNVFNLVIINSHIQLPGDKFIVDPLSESFFVSEDDYLEGVFLSSAELFFKEKSEVSPVTFEIRPSVNGYPSSTEIIPFSQVTLGPDDIEISDDATKSTKFIFPSPVYLKSGDYHFVARAIDTYYKIWIARLGHFELGSQDVRVSKNPYIGVLFKSANNQTWIPDSDADLKFRLNRCSFDTINSYKCQLENKVYKSNLVTTTDKSFNTIRENIISIIPDNTSINDISIKMTSIDKIIKTKNIRFNETIELFDEIVLFDKTSISPQSVSKPLINQEEKDDSLIYNEYYSKDSLVDVNNYFDPSFITTCNFSTMKESVSPMIDLQRLSSTLVLNKINNLLTDEELLSEEESNGGMAIARYVMKSVTLASDTPANKLFVAFTGMIPNDVDANCSIRVYYKIYNSLKDAGSTFAQKKWVFLAQTGSKSNSETNYIDFEYQTDLLEYPDNSSIIDFDQFSIKLVLLSSKSAFVPKVKEFVRVIALTE